MRYIFQSTRPSQTSTLRYPTALWHMWNFNPRGLRRPRLVTPFLDKVGLYISIHEAFADLDMAACITSWTPTNFNPRGLRRPRRDIKIFWSIWSNFNPRGLRRPRRWFHTVAINTNHISIHEAFADLDSIPRLCNALPNHFNPRGLRRPRPRPR